MINLYDIAWGIAVGAAAPYWALKPSARRKVTKAFRERMGQGVPTREGDDPCVLIHAVSLGEMNATRALVAKLREFRPGIKFVISSTTDTGFERGRELYAPSNDVTLIRYPLDFTSAVNRVLDAQRPDVVVLMELEVWPNFVRQCKTRGIPVILANARLTETSFRNYKRGSFLVRRMFRNVTLICAQDEQYGIRFLELGVPHKNIVIAGTMKFDNANLAPPPRTAYLRAERLGVQVGFEQLWVCGSTGEGEEEMILNVYNRLLRRFNRLRLIIVPRHPQRFDEVAEIVREHRFDCVRFTQVDYPSLDPGSPIAPVILIDAMGVLREFYSIADVVFVGRSLVDLGVRQHGSDMIEPAALGKPTIVGPFTTNFADAMLKFRAFKAMHEVKDEAELEAAVTSLLASPKDARLLGVRAASVVQREMGATNRHARVIMQILCVRRGEELPAFPPAQPSNVQSPTGAPASQSAFSTAALTQAPQWLEIRPIR